MENEVQEEVQQKSEEGKQESRVLPQKKVKLLLGGAVLSLALLGLGWYGFTLKEVKSRSTQPFVLKSAEIFGFRAAEVQGKSLSYGDYMHEFEVVKKLSQNPLSGGGATSDEQVSNLVVGNFLSQVKIEEVASRFGVTVSLAEIEAEKAKMIEQYKKEELEKNIQEMYGWDLDTYVKKLVAPGMLAQKTSEHFEKNTDVKTSTFVKEEAHVHHILIKVADEKEKAEKKKIADSLLLRLKRGEDFAKLAKQFSEDEGSKETGGDLGFVPKGVTVEPFNTIAFTIEPKKLSDLVETEFGFHILKVDERKVSADFGKFMDSEIRAMQPKMFFGISNPIETILKAQS